VAGWRSAGLPGQKGMPTTGQRGLPEALGPQTIGSKGDRNDPISPDSPERSEPSDKDESPEIPGMSI